MNIEEAQELLKRYADNQCTPEEKILVERWYLKESGESSSAIFAENLEGLNDEMWLGTLKKAGLKSAAAAILLFFAFGIYFYRSPEAAPNEQKVMKPADPLPGGSKAVLTLSNGTQIILDDIAIGKLAVQGNITIFKSENGQVIYDASAAANETGEAGNNTISTPRGGQYQVILPDGSKVWLNSDSSINFPTSFTGAQRNVSLTGEAYFEVASNPQKPFNVSANRSKISVLGTHFNLMAYSDEAFLRATLLEGSIRVSSGAASLLVKPGEQADIKSENIIVSEADIAGSIAWKNGYFYFKKTDIKAVMRQISRWYDLDVEYRGEIPKTEFSGKMYRNVNATKVLEILSYFKVNYRLEEAGSSGRRKIIIL
jgi:hypothetical protein